MILDRRSTRRQDDRVLDLEDVEMCVFQNALLQNALQKYNTLPGRVPRVSSYHKGFERDGSYFYQCIIGFIACSAVSRALESDTGTVTKR